MPSITFKLMGIISDSGERQILIDSESTLKEVKNIVRKSFKLVPNSKISFLHQGKRYSDDDLLFKYLSVDPRKEKITVIVSNPYS